MRVYKSTQCNKQYAINAHTVSLKENTWYAISILMTFIWFRFPDIK